MNVEDETVTNDCLYSAEAILSCWKRRLKEFACRSPVFDTRMLTFFIYLTSTYVHDAQ